MNKRLPRRQSPRTIVEQGFTILEILVAFGILSTTVVALVGLRTQSIRNFILIQNSMAATIVAEDRMERVMMQSQGMDPIEMTNPELLERYEGLDFEVSHWDEEPLEEEIPPGLVYPTGWTIRKYIIEVKWRLEGGKTRTTRIERVVAILEKYLNGLTE